MLILALDTTTRAGSVAVTDDDLLLAVVHGDAGRTHGERLPGEIDRALTSAGVTPSQLTLLAVASGPGAFTGLRIGLAAMQGMAMVLRIPVIGVSALDALAWEAWAVRCDDERQVIAWMDAQRGEVFAAHYLSDHMEGVAFSPAIGQPIVGSPEAALALVPALDGLSAGVLCVGDGAVRYRAELEARVPGRCRVIDTPDAIAPAVARIGRRRAGRGLAGQPHALQPLYVRRPDAELERQRRFDA